MSIPQLYNKLKIFLILQIFCIWEGVFNFANLCRKQEIPLIGHTKIFEKKKAKLLEEEDVCQFYNLTGK